MASTIFSSRQVGKMLGADPSSVNRWIDSGKLNAYRTPGGHRRVLKEDLLTFLEECGMPIPDELKPEQITVLLVDDDEHYLRSVRKSLLRVDRNLDVHTINSGYEALIQIGAQHPDLVVLDVYMPGLDGVEVCQRIKSNPETQDVMVIANTAHPSSTLEKRVLEAGADVFLVKPFKASVILDYVRGRSVKRAS